ncbi:MAG: uroporphyrinogen decarboxylase [bacterium]|nr:uroporphyrinogen decarboxylase [bacterium]
MSESLFIRACRKEPIERTPLWMMRQAGRYLPEYRAVRAKSDFLTMCRTPELAAEVTLQPIRRFGFDAAVIFSDIMIPLEPLGFGVSFGERGPSIAHPLRQASDVPTGIPDGFEEQVAFVYRSIELVRQELPEDVPVLGFAGAPFTLASYLIEGGGSKSYAETKTFFYHQPEAAHRLLGLLADAVGRHLVAQVNAGAGAVQLFDSWAGVLSEQEYRVWALPYVQRAMRVVADAQVPRILFTLNAAHLYSALAEVEAEALGIDWRTPMGQAFDLLGDRFALQGNLDPTVLLGTPDQVSAEVRRVLSGVGGRRGHIMNLGHGVLPPTPIANVETLVRAVADFKGEG